MVIPQLNLCELIRLPLNNCKCGSDNISIAECYTLGVQNYCIIKCMKCDREIKRRSYKRAEQAWNKNNPKKARGNK